MKFIKKVNGISIKKQYKPNSYKYIKFLKISLIVNFIQLFVLLTTILMRH